MGMTDDPNFSKLPARDIDLHRWWVAQQGNPPSLADMGLDCIAQADASIKEQTHSFRDKPLVDVSAAGTLRPVPPAEAEMRGRQIRGVADKAPVALKQQQTT